MKAALLQVAEIAEANGIEVIDKAAAEKIAEIKKDDEIKKACFLPPLLVLYKICISYLIK